jgi:hypothetical protein
MGMLYLYLYPLNTKLGGPQKRFGNFTEEKNLLPLPGFETRTVKPVAQSPQRIRYPLILKYKEPILFILRANEARNKLVTDKLQQLHACSIKLEEISPFQDVWMQNILNDSLA